MSRYHIVRLRCDARRPFDCCSRCSAMTVDPNCPTSLASGYVAVMNRGVGQKAGFWAHSPDSSVRNVNTSFLRDSLLKIDRRPLVSNHRLKTRCFSFKITNKNTLRQHLVLHGLFIWIKFWKFTRNFVSLRIFFPSCLYLLYIFITFKFFIIKHLRGLLFPFSSVVRDISLYLIDQPDE